MNEGPDRGYYAALDARRLTLKRKPARERPIKKPTGFCRMRRRREPTEDELIEMFTAEMEAQGRGAAAFDDEDGELFYQWCRHNGFDY